MNNENKIKQKMDKNENNINRNEKENYEKKGKENLNKNLEINNNININFPYEEKQENNNKEENDNENNDGYDYRALCSDKVLGRFSLHDKICIINKLNLIVYGRIKKELLMELKKKRFENKILLIKSRFKTALILQKRLHSLVQEKMLRDFNFKKNLKDLRKKLMDEKIEKLKYKNLVFIMKTYGIYHEDKCYR